MAGHGCCADHAAVAGLFRMSLPDLICAVAPVAERYLRCCAYTLRRLTTTRRGISSTCPLSTCSYMGGSAPSASRGCTSPSRRKQRGRHCDAKTGCTSAPKPRIACSAVMVWTAGTSITPRCVPETVKTAQKPSSRPGTRLRSTASPPRASPRSCREPHVGPAPRASRAATHREGASRVVVRAVRALLPARAVALEHRCSG